MPARQTGRSDERIGVLLAMSHQLDCDLLDSYLASRADFTIVARAGTKAELEAAVHGPMPDVILLGLTGPMAANRIRVSDVRHSFPEVPVLAAAPHDENECPMLRLTRQQAETGHVGQVSPVPDCLAVAVMQGAHGAIRRTASLHDLCEALRQVADGATWFDPSLSARLVRWTDFVRSRSDKLLLSPREVDVARLIVRGRSNKEIAVSLGLSEPTVKKHVGHLMQKLELDDRLQLGLFLIRHRFLLERALPESDLITS